MTSRAAGGDTTLSRTEPSAGTIRLRLPFPSPRMQKMLAAYLVLLSVPSTFLDFIGYDYSSIGGLPFTKIHIATYFAVLTFVVFVVSYPRKADLARYYLATKLGTIYFFLATTFAVINIVVGGRSGFGMYFDTDLHLFACCMLLPFVPPDGMERLERFVHWFFAVNAVLGIFELVSGINVFPLMTYSPDGITTLEPRSTAFLSHPLHAASVTCAYIVSLLLGAGKLLRADLRVPMIVLQTMALLAFGGRTAFLLTLVIVAVGLAWQVLKFAGGKHVPRVNVILAIATVPVGIAVIAMLAHAGFFDQFLDRFTEDGGSARSRVLMIPLLWSFDWSDFLWGANTDYARAQVYSFGLEWGVENPFLQMSVYQGVVVACLVMSGLLLLLYDVYKRLEPYVIFPIVIYLLLCNTFGSFAGRFVNFSIFIVMISALFRRRDVPRDYVT